MPGKYYVYIPFSSSDKGGNEHLVKSAQGWRENRINYSGSINSPTQEQLKTLKRKVPTILVRESGKRVLADLVKLEPTDYTLYVMAHCNAGRNTVFNIQGVYDQDRTTLTEVELVSRLVEDGLPQNVMNLKLYSCFGGSSSETEAAFGEKLYRELCRRNFYLVKLTAYQRALKAATASVSTGHKRTEHDARPSSVARTWGPPQLEFTPMGARLMEHLKSESKKV